MHPIKLALKLMILFLFMIALPNSVFAFPQYKVALLPVINTANLQTMEVSDLIQYKIHRKLRFPFYEFIPDTEIAYAIKTLPVKNGYIVPDQKNLSSLSRALSADIVLIAEIVTAQVNLQNHFSLLYDDETIESTDVRLKCYAYSANDNKYYLMKTEKYNSAPLNVNSGLRNAADPVIDELLRQMPFQTIPTCTSLNITN